MLFTTLTFVILFLPTVLLGYFLLGRRSETWAAAWLLFLVDGRRTGPAIAPNEMDLQRWYLIASLMSHGVDVVDLEPVYAEHAARSRLSLEVGPYDRHLNGLGVRLVMAQAARAFAP